MGKLLGVPEDQEYDYEFMVVFQRDDGDFDWHSSHETMEAFAVAKEVVWHDITVTKKRKKEVSEKIPGDSYDFV